MLLNIFKFEFSNKLLKGLSLSSIFLYLFDEINFSNSFLFFVIINKQFKHIIFGVSKNIFSLEKRFLEIKIFLLDK